MDKVLLQAPLLPMECQAPSAPLATNCWPEAPWEGGGGVGILGPAKSAPSWYSTGRSGGMCVCVCVRARGRGALK